MNDVYGLDTVPSTGKQIIKNGDKILEVIEINHHVNDHSIAQELKIDRETILKYFHKSGFEEKIYVWVPNELT